MSNTINESTYSAYNTHRNQGASGGDNITKYVQKLFSKNGISGNVELDRDSEGRLSVMNDHPQKEEIESLLNNDEKLSSMLARQKPAATDEQDTAKDEQGVYHENADGDSVFISDVAQEAYVRHKSNYLGTTDAKAMTFDEYLEYSRNNIDPELFEADKRAELQVNWKSFSNFGQNRDTWFDMRSTGSMVFASPLGLEIPLRGLEREMAPGKSANIQEKEVMAQASASRKKAYDQLHSAMKRSGVELKQGQKVDFVMDEKGNIQVNSKSTGDKRVASKIEDIIKNDPKLSASIRDYLHVSLTSTESSPASMRMNVDSVLREYTGKGFDDLEWDSSGTLVAPEGFEDAMQDFSGLGYMVGHLKSLQESEGDAIFKKEFSFSVTASGITGDQIRGRASTNLFRDDKMFDNKGYYTDEYFTDVNGNKTDVLKAQPQRENYQSEYWGMESLKGMIQKQGVSVFITSNPDSSFVVDEKGNKQALPYQSENYNATAQYLIEDHLIKNGVEGKVSDYALKINSKGSYEVVRLSDSKGK